MNSAKRVIAKFGSQAKIAAAVGKAESTAYNWAKVGTIPQKWHSPLLRIAQERGIELSPEDFIPLDVGKTDAEENYLVVSPSVHQKPVAKWHGTIDVGEVELPSFVLDDGRRVISRRGATEALTNNRGGGNLESYLNVIALSKYLPKNISEDIIEFTVSDSDPTTIKGMSAETFLDICKAYVTALGDGGLETDRQREIAVQAAVFLSSCAKIGLTALIDEATGYQYARPVDALQIKLKMFLEEEMRKWEKTFPDELWVEFARLTSWRGVSSQRPKYWGKLVMELVYDYLDKDVSDWLKQNNPKPRHGQNYHQWLSGQFGLKKLTEHIWMLIGMSRACYTMRELKEKMAERFGRQPVQYTLYLEPPRNQPAQRKQTQLPASAITADKVNNDQLLL